MSRLPSFSGIFSAISEGVQSIFGYLSQFFRMGPFAGVEPPGVAEPSRPRLTTPEQIIEQAQARHILPPVGGPQLRTASFFCTITNTDTGEMIPLRHQIQYEQGSLSRSGLYSRAYRFARSQIQKYFPGEGARSPNFTISCRRLSDVVVPSQSP